MTNTPDWDAIVIGAGLAGLSCAAHLGKAGQRVVVIEQHSRPGGLWSSFSRRGLIFDLSTHWVTDPYGLNRMLEGLGGPPVDFVQLEHIGRYVGPPFPAGRNGAGAGSATHVALSPAWDILVSTDVDAFKASVRASFPSVDEAAVSQLVREAISISRLLDSLPIYSPELAPLSARLRDGLKLLPSVPRLRSLGKRPAEEYLQKLFPGEALAGLRAALYTLAPITDMPAFGPLAILGTGLRGRAYSPRGGSQTLAHAFAAAAEHNGVQIWYSRKAVSIEISSGAVSGVTLEDGSELHAPAVVSAADAKETFYRLLGGDNVSEAYKRLLEAQPVSEPYGLISLVTTLDPAAMGFDGADVFACPSADVPAVLESKEPEDCPFLLIFPRYSEPGADPGLRAVQVVVPAAFAWRGHWETGSDYERGAAYQALKDEWTRTILPRVQKYFPRLASHLVLIDVATPITFYRYTLNTEGAPVGWHYKSRRRWKQRVPFVRGLYQAGHWVGPSGAVPVTRSGKWAAELVLRDMRQA